MAPLSLFGRLLLCLFIVIPVLRVIFKYWPTPWLMAILWVLLFFIAVQLLLSARSNKFQLCVANPWLLFIGSLICISACWHFYPIADGLKNQMLGSDQDNCIISGATNLLQGLPPYLTRSYFGNPCSPGPGLLLLYLPFVALHIYIAGALFAIGALTLALYQEEKKLLFVGTFLVSIFFCLAIPELLIVGSDLILVGCGIAFLCLKIPVVLGQKNYLQLIGLSFLCGLLASSRVNFLALPFVFFLFIFSQWRFKSILFLMVSLITATLPGILIYTMDPNNFTPFHLLSKAETLLPLPLMLFVAGVCLLSAAMGLYRFTQNLLSLSGGVFITLAPMLLALALSDLSRRHWELAQWEGANYLIPLIPLSALLFLLPNQRVKNELWPD